MAKKMISRLSVLAVLIVFLAACSKTVEYTNIIPADATVVTSINLKSLASKAGLNDKENEAAKQKVLEALKSGMNAATFQQLEKVMNNPSESGIDVEAPVYVFTSPSFPYSTAVAKIKSEDDLHASLEIMVKEQICQPINEAAGYSFTTMNGGLAGLNFEKGRIALKTENYTENEAVKALMKKQLEAFGKANNTFVKYFPASTLMFVNLGIKGEGLYNLLSENKEFRNTVSISKADEVKELFSSFNGDISAGLINVTMNSAPTFIVYADVKNGNALEALYKNKQALGLKKGEDILELGKNEYVYKSKGMNVFFGIKDKQMYATNDELLYKNIEKAADKSIKDAPYASEMKGKNVFMAINAEAILELPVVKMLIGFGGEKFRTGSEMLSKVSYLSVSSEGETSEIDLCLKDKDVNALKLIVDFGKQFTGM